MFLNEIIPLFYFINSIYLTLRTDPSGKLLARNAENQLCFTTENVEYLREGVFL